MPDSVSRSQRFRGRRPPTHGDGWQVTTVARRGTNRSARTSCAVTDREVRLDEPHWYVTLRYAVEYSHRPDRYDHLVVAEDALEALDEWLED